jgi:hypothetical protein
MSRSPLVIVGCTDRKSLPVHSKLSLSSLPKNLTAEDAADRWINTYKAEKAELESKHSVQLRHLYQGEYWKIALEIDNSYETLVASAGLGMHRLDDEGLGYSATFSQGPSDSVLRFQYGSVSQARKSWWRIINDQDGPGSSIWKVKCAPENGGRRSVFVVVSEGYQQALANDIVEIAEEWADVVVVSGSKPLKDFVEAPHIDHIRVGQNLRMLLKGSTSSVGIRFVSRFLESGRDQNAESAQKYLTKLNDDYQNLAAEEKLPKFSRNRFVDNQAVIDWIIEAMEDPTVTKPSKSTLLRRLRDGGGACEQSRFGDCFDEALAQLELTGKTVSKRR